MAKVVKVVDHGLKITTDRLSGGGTEPKYVDWGTGVTGAADDDSGMESAGGETRATGTSSQQTTSTTDDTYQVIATLTCSGAAKDITEMGQFDAVSAGNMYLHATFSSIHVDVGDGIQFTTKVQHQQG